MDLDVAQKASHCRSCGVRFALGTKEPFPGICSRPACMKFYRRFIRRYGPPVFLPLESFYGMLKALDEEGMDRERFMVFVLGKTGLRLTEFLELKPRDLFFGEEERKISVPSFRSRRSRAWLHVSAEVAGVLEGWIKDRSLGPNDLLFPYSKSMARHLFRLSLKAAKLPTAYHIRSLRHLYGLTVARAGVDRKRLAEILREEDPRVCDLYFRMAREFEEGL